MKRIFVDPENIVSVKTVIGVLKNWGLAGSTLPKNQGDVEIIIETNREPKPENLNSIQIELAGIKGVKKII